MCTIRYQIIVTQGAERAVNDTVSEEGELGGAPHFEYPSKFLWPFWKAREILQSATSKALPAGGEMAQQRWLLVVLSEDPSSVPSSRGSEFSSQLPHQGAYT